MAPMHTITKKTTKAGHLSMGTQWAPTVEALPMAQYLSMQLNLEIWMAKSKIKHRWTKPQASWAQLVSTWPITFHLNSWLPPNSSSLSITSNFNSVKCTKASQCNKESLVQEISRTSSISKPKFLTTWNLLSSTSLRAKREWNQLLPFTKTWKTTEFHSKAPSTLPLASRKSKSKTNRLFTTLLWTMPTRLIKASAAKLQPMALLEDSINLESWRKSTRKEVDLIQTLQAIAILVRRTNNQWGNRQPLLALMWSSVCVLETQVLRQLVPTGTQLETTHIEESNSSSETFNLIRDLMNWSSTTTIVLLK